MKASRYFFPTLFLSLSLQNAAAQTTPWLTDDQARDIASATVHALYPEPCYTTSRDEHLEGLIFNTRRDRIAGNQLNRSVYVYHLTSDNCDYIAEENGKPVIRTETTMDCCDYGFVVVDRVTSKSYWFRGEKKPDLFNTLARDEQFRSASSKPVFLTMLYRELVWGTGDHSEITSLNQLEEIVQKNFRPAYSPYGKNHAWQGKFKAWWREFRSKMPHLNLETTYETTAEGIIVRGYSFQGFQLTMPESDPPPKGTPELLQWALLAKPDGTIEPQPPKIVYPR